MFTSLKLNPVYIMLKTDGSRRDILQYNKIIFMSYRKQFCTWNTDGCGSSPFNKSGSHGNG